MNSPDEGPLGYRAEGYRAEGYRAEGDRAQAVASTQPPSRLETGAAEGLGEEAVNFEAVNFEAVNFEEPALIELELDGTDYRMDAGRAGTALCISTRPSGTWSWTFRGEARWQAKVLRCRAFDRTVLARLSQALAEISENPD